MLPLTFSNWYPLRFEWDSLHFLRGRPLGASLVSLDFPPAGFLLVGLHLVVEKLVLDIVVVVAWTRQRRLRKLGIAIVMVRSKMMTHWLVHSGLVLVVIGHLLAVDEGIGVLVLCVVLDARGSG